MLKRCEKNLKKWKLDFELFFGAAESLPFADNEFEVVFHAGGIKFFSDKRAAIKEMIRVAKPGTKIIIMDQADKLADDVLKVPIARQFFKGLKEMTVAPVDLVPEEMQDVRLDYVLNGGCYLLEFRKPAVSAARLVDHSAKISRRSASGVQGKALPMFVSNRKIRVLVADVDIDENRGALRSSPKFSATREWT